MKSLAAVLAAWVVSGYVISRFLPVPFLGMALSFSIYPFVQHVSWMELYWVYFMGQIMMYVMNPETLPGSYQMMMAATPDNLAGFAAIVFVPTLIIAIIVAPVIQASVIKTVVHFFGVPKMLRRLPIQ